MRCPSCDLDNREGRKFCAGCGAAIGWACPACGFSNAPGEGFCGGCGRAAGQPERAATPQVVQTARATTGEATGERRQVAILFADLCGFTQLSAQLDAEDLGRLVEAFYARADGIVAQYGGTVDKHIGDAVMALFGAPVAHGDDALRALRAALDIQASVGELNDPWGKPLATHVGIASGEVIAGGMSGGYTVLGDAVNLAARLVELARPGETVISEPLMHLLEGKVRAQALAPVSLKGIGAPVTGWRVEELAPTTAATTPFVGRTSDRAMLSGLLQACRDSAQGRVVVLRGDAGIGKTRLLDEVAAEARQRGFATHKTLVLDFGTGKGQDAMRLLTRGLLDIAAGADKHQRRAAAERAQARGWLRPEDRASLDDLLDLPTEVEGRALYQAMDEATRQSRRRTLLRALLTRAAAERALLVVVEDLHWADPALLEDLASLGAATAEAPVLLMATTRPDGDPLDRAWRAKLGHAAVSTIDLSPLSAAEALELAAGQLGSGDERIAPCVERAGGNPFFLEQLLRHTGEVAAAAVPASVQSLVLGRADRLPAAEKRALQAASILGQRVPLAALRHLLGEPGYEAAYLTEQHFLRRDGADLAFVHALMRDGIYGSLLKARRREFHRAAALWYGERDLQLRAQHLDMGEDAEAPAAYLAAAEAASASYRTAQALALAQRGLALAGEKATKVTLATLSGELLQALGRTEEAVAAFRTAGDAAEPGQAHLRALLGLANGLSVLDRLDEAAALIDRLEPEAKARGLAAERSRLHSLRGNIHFPRGEIARCLAEHSQALEWAEAAGETEEQARALGGLADANYMRGLFRTSGRMFARCVELSAAQGFRRIEAANRPMLGMMLMMEMDFEGALQQAQRAIALAEQIGHRRAAMIAQHGLHFLYFEKEDHSRALEAGLAGTKIARALGARRFIGEGLMLQALGEYFSADPRAGETIRAANDIGREQPSYMLPFGLGVAAIIAKDAVARAAALAEGEAVLAAGAVSHNFFFFNRLAIEACLAARDWASVERYAAALERSMVEPLPMTDFLVARARALAAAGRGQRDEVELKRLVSEAKAVGWRMVLPSLEAALAEG